MISYWKKIQIMYLCLSVGLSFVSLNPMMMIFYIYLYMACRLMYCISSFHEKSKSLHHKYDMWNLFDFLLVMTHHKKFKFVMVKI
jgi:hypothetical protein